jgi:hypothetical protein
MLLKRISGQPLNQNGTSPRANQQVNAFNRDAGESKENFLMPLLKEFDLITSGSKEKVRAFQLQTRCVTALYQRLFPKLMTKDCWKVLVRCVNDAPKTQYRNIGGVYEPFVVADVEGFFHLNDSEKKVWAFGMCQAF